MPDRGTFAHAGCLSGAEAIYPCTQSPPRPTTYIPIHMHTRFFLPLFQQGLFLRAKPCTLCNSHELKENRIPVITVLERNVPLGTEPDAVATVLGARRAVLRALGTVFYALGSLHTHTHKYKTCSSLDTILWQGTITCSPSPTGCSIAA